MSGRTAKAARRAAAGNAAKPRKAQAPKLRSTREPNRWRPLLWVGPAVVAAIVGLYLIAGRGGSSEQQATAGGGGSEGSAYPYAVGAPGPGQAAPPVKLPSTAGGTFDLAAYKGKEPVLLYFQEGLMCQPCWDQLVAMERDKAKFKALGIGPIVSITGDPLDLLEQKAKDEGFSFPVLSDPTFEVSDSYDARTYGMMGGSMNGHTFVLVGENGNIVWRADYGGEPNYFMFVPDDVILAEIRQTLGKSA